MKSLISILEREEKRLKEAVRIRKLEESITKLRLELNGDPAHPASEGWEWDGDLGVWEQRNPPQEHIDV